MVPDRATCEECIKLNLNNCEDCCKPLETLPGNAFAIGLFQKANAHKIDYLTLTIAQGGTEDDYNKVLLIDSINRRINGRQQQT